MYVFHFYAGSHMGLLDRVDAVADRIPLFVSEWGASMASGGGASDYAGALLYLRLFEGAGTQGVKLSWAKWNYADKDEASAALMPGACGRGAWDDTSCSGTFIKRYIKANVQTCGRTRSPPAPTPAPVPTTPAPPVPTTPAPPAPTPTPVQACVGEWGTCTDVPTCCGDFSVHGGLDVLRRLRVRAPEPVVRTVSASDAGSRGYPIAFTGHWPSRALANDPRAARADTDACAGLRWGVGGVHGGLDVLRRLRRAPTSRRAAATSRACARTRGTRSASRRGRRRPRPPPRRRTPRRDTGAWSGGGRAGAARRAAMGSRACT
eukprot:TRINITY_DN5969_c0_g2_i2.p1 TRINITY_DN5969_c0_g2~~TRINITY_DN5969_c0_g2_i2.p1  ORF type:complete len:320 (+),score=33.49 TRINITY_DN5969_c0_g2_i2:755-1714(+)